MPRVPKDNCLSCGHMVDAAAGVGDDAPSSPGDITICLYCCHIMAFDENLRLREITDAEARAIAGDEQLLLTMETIREFHREREHT